MLDRLYVLTGGFHPGHRILVASRPAVGRSTVARLLAEASDGLLFDVDPWRTPPVAARAVFTTYRLPRSVERRALARPVLTDIAPSVLPVADIVLLLYRRSFYDIDAPRDLVEIIVAKSPLSTGSLTFPLVPGDLR